MKLIHPTTALFTSLLLLMSCGGEPASIVGSGSEMSSKDRLPAWILADVPAAPAVAMVMYIHGGGWQNGHSRQSGAFENWPATLAMIAARGCVVTSINYRLSGEAPFPASIQDVKTALRWLRAHAGESDCVQALEMSLKFMDDVFQ
jgi:acetyl esterase/lipase